MPTTYETDPSAQYAQWLCAQGTDWIARFLRMLLITLAFASCIFSYLTLASCNFLKYFPQPPGFNSTDSVSAHIGFEEFWGDNPPTLGLNKHNPTGEVCLDYGNGELMGREAVRAARLFGALGAILGTIALLLLIVEFICCRFWCSRVIIVIILLLAAIIQFLTFALFLDDVCGGRKGNKYLCDLDQGGNFAIVSGMLYLATSILTCPTPKSVPLLRVVRDMEKLSVVDPCCCFPGRSRDDVLEEQATLIEMIEDDAPPEAVKVDGYEYKQYYDSKAGITLQDQFTASYNRWVACEEVYDRTLDRFKAECGEVELAWREVKKMPLDEIDDDEIRRLVVLLSTQRAKSERAREDMDRIQDELETVITPVAPDPDPTSADEELKVLVQPNGLGQSTKFGACMDTGTNKEKQDGTISSCDVVQEAADEAAVEETAGNVEILESSTKNDQKESLLTERA